MSLHATRAASCRLLATRAETAQCLSKAYGEDAAAVIGGGGSRYPLIWNARALKLERSSALFVASRMSFKVVALYVRMLYNMCVSTVGYARAGAAVTARGSSRAASAGRGGGPSGPDADDVTCVTLCAPHPRAHVLSHSYSTTVRFFKDL